LPILHIQITAEAQASNGTSIPITPSNALTQRGPVVQVTVNVEQHIAQQLLQEGQVLPTPVSGLALLDTGATRTCIDETVAQSLHLPVIDVATIASATHASTQQNVYPIQIEVSGLPIKINAPKAIGVPLSVQGLIVLIGRDVLQNCTLFYNGLTGSFTLSI